MNRPKYLNKLSSYFFLSSFFVGKLKLIPVALVSSLFNMGSLILGFTGYAFWYLATYFYPNQAPAEDKWYGFSKISEQQKISAMFGLLATTTGILGIAFPIVLVPSGWLFVIANTYWLISEYHKLNNPPTEDPNYNPQAQSDYVTYAAVMTSIGLLGAVAATLAIFFPAIAVPVLTTSSILGVGLGFLAFEYWLKSTCAPAPVEKEPPVTTSYDQVTEILGTKQNTLKLHSAPYHEKNFLKDSALSTSELEPKSSCMNKL